MITGVTLTCPQCGVRYRVRVDLAKLRHVRSRARCSSCSATFDVAEGIAGFADGSSGHPTPAQGLPSPTPAGGLSAPGRGHHSLIGARSLTPNSLTPARGIPRATPAPFPSDASKTPVGSLSPVADTAIFSLPAPKAKPGILRLSDLPDEEPPTLVAVEAPMDIEVPVMPASTIEWLSRALLPLDDLARDPSEGEQALDRLLDGFGPMLED